MTSTTTARHTYSPGKTDYNGSGRRNCPVVIEWEITEAGEFHMSGSIRFPNNADSYSCGQNIDEISALFPHDAKIQRMHAIWQRWHLNHRQAASPAQREWLRANPIVPEEYRYPASYYDVASTRLAEAGLNPDTSFERTASLSANVRTNDGYRYGSAWLHEELPSDVIAEIESWS